MESLFLDIRQGLRGLRRSPLFAASVASTIGLGLGVLCSAFTLINAYLLKPIDLPNPRELYSPTWDTATVRRHRFGLADFEALREGSPHYSGLAAATEGATVMQGGTPMGGILVTGNYHPLLGTRPALGRMLGPSDASTPGAGSVLVLSDSAWRSRFGADPSIVGKEIQIGRHVFEVVGVAQPASGLSGEELVSFWAPITMASAFDLADPWADPARPSLVVIGRLKPTTTDTQARAWLEVWLRQRFPAGSASAPVAVHVESRSTRLPLTGATLTLFTIILTAFGLVLLIACANVTNLMLARGFGRQREIAVRLSLGASRRRIVCQLITESLVLAVPAAAIGLVLTLVTARVFPALVLSTFPSGVLGVQSLLAPLDPDYRVITVLAIAAVASAVLVSVVPALRVTRANLVRASKGEVALETDRSRLRTGLVALQIGACVLFLVVAAGLIAQSQRMARPTTTLPYERVVDVRVAPDLRGDVATRLASDPSIDRVAATWRPPFAVALQHIGVVASGTRIQQSAGYMVVSPEYFQLFDIQVVRGRLFTGLEADERAPVALVSQATANVLWPGVDPIGQTLDLLPPTRYSAFDRPLPYKSVRVIGVTEDVTSGTLTEGTDPTCIYLATGFRAEGEMSILVSARADIRSVRAAVEAAVNATRPDAPFRLFPIREMVGAQAWIFGAFSAAASFAGLIGLVLAFSGTYAVVAFLVTQRTREFGIRMALGATVSHIVTGILGDTLRTASIGLAIGLAVAGALVTAVRSSVEIVQRFGATPYVIGAAIVLTATMIAALLPSIRTARIDPSKALRVE